MADPADIAAKAAAEALPGWRQADPSPTQKTPPVAPETDTTGMDMATLKQKYGDAAPQPSSLAADITVFVEMTAQGADAEGPTRRKVVVTGGKVSGFQG